MKTVGGLGYVFLLVPFLNIVSPILVGVAWVQMGRRTGQTIFTATGVLMIVLFVFTVVVLSMFSWLLWAFAPFMSSLAFGFPLDAGFSQLLSFSLLLLLLAGLLGVIGLVTFIFELVSHFRAARVYGNRWFRRAAWLRIIAVVLAIVSAVALVIFSSPIIPAIIQTQDVTGILQSIGSFMFLGLVPVIILAFLATVFSAVAFFTLESEYPPGSRYYPPSPPP